MKIKKFNESIDDDGESWKDIFRKQVSTGSYWKDLLKRNFDDERFLMRGDAVFICKKAQSDMLNDILSDLEKRGMDKDGSIRKIIEDKLKKHWDTDDSALGMWDGKKIL